MFKKLSLLFILLVHQSLLAQVSDQQLALIKNDKEISISVFSKAEAKKIQTKYADPAFNNQIINSFNSTLSSFVNDDNNKQCEFGFIRDFKRSLSKLDFYYDYKSIEDYLKILRINNSIDDILYGILSLANTDFYEIRHMDFEKSRRSRLSSRKKVLKQNDLKELFSGFSNEWPDDYSRCTYQEFYYVRTNIYNKNSKKDYKNGDLRALLSKAHKDNVINLETYNKLHYLTTKSKVEKTDLWLRDYLKIIFNAKNKLIPLNSTYSVKNIADEDGYTSERNSRFSKITKRRVLYRKYNETQIILLAQVLQKASRRMGVDPDTQTELPMITQRFTNIFPDGQRETYVEELELDSQSQYNLARRRMRKDILELQMMDTFNGVKITYQDIIVAAFETGYISQEDIEFVVKYDDLWNPSKTKAERIIGFIFTGLGYASFVVPPPWNITASVALGIVEGIVSNKFKKGADNDNPATFIE